MMTSYSILLTFLETKTLLIATSRVREPFVFSFYWIRKFELIYEFEQNELKHGK